jgi:hypothetical protein
MHFSRFSTDFDVRLMSGNTELAIAAMRWKPFVFRSTFPPVGGPLKALVLLSFHYSKIIRSSANCRITSRCSFVVGLRSSGSFGGHGGE